MPPQAIAFAAPSGEEMTETVVGIAGAGIAGVVEGTVVMFSKTMGTLEPLLSWGALLGIPVAGIAGALFTRGMLGDFAKGVAAGGTAILGYSLPAILAPTLFVRKAPAPGAGQLGAGQPGAKQLGQGAAASAEAARRALGSRVGIEF